MLYKDVLEPIKAEKTSKENTVGLCMLYKDVLEPIKAEKTSMWVYRLKQHHIE